MVSLIFARLVLPLWVIIYAAIILTNLAQFFFGKTPIEDRASKLSFAVLLGWAFPLMLIHPRGRLKLSQLVEMK